MTVEVGALIGVCCAVVGALGTFATMKRAARKEAIDEGKNGGTILTEIGYIKSGVDDIKRKQEQIDVKLLDMAVKMAKIESAVKSAHNRLDDHLRYEHHQTVEKRGQND